MPHVYFLLMCFFTCLAFSTFSQNQGIRGRIIDANTQDPLVAATVKLGEGGVLADDLGAFELALAPGQYELEIFYIGYVTKKISCLVSANQWLDQRIGLNPAENVLQTAVISDSRFSKPLSESTISIEVLKSSLLDHLNSTSISQVLDKVPGLNMVGDQANIRGGAGYSYGAGSRVLLLINDLPALQADAGYPNWDDVPVENIEQIEVIKGAASASYGSSALNGLIHVRTKYAKSEPVTKASIFFNPILSPRDKSQKWWTTSPYSTGINFSHAHKLGQWDVVAGAYGFKSKSYNQTSGSEYARINGSIQYRITDRFVVGSHLNMNKRSSTNFFYWRDGVHAIYRPDSSTMSTSNSFRYHLDPYISYFDKSKNKHALRSRIYVVDNKTTNNQSNSSTLVYSEYQFQRFFEKIGLFTSAGMVFNYNTSNSELFSRIPFHTTNLGVYTQFEKKIKNHTTVAAGWRYEDYKLSRPEIFGTDTLIGGIKKEQKSLFRFGVNSKLNKGLFARASWGQGFRFPTLAEQFIVTSFGSTFISPNPTLISESGWNAELGLKQGFRKGTANGYLDAAIFWSRYKDMMEFVFTGFVKGFQSQNIGDTDIKGFEVTLAGSSEWGNHKLSASGGYTFIEPKFIDFTEEDNRRSSANFNILKYRSKHLFKLDIEDQVGVWTFGSGILYTSKMEAIDAIFELVIKGLKQYRESHGGYTLMDLRIAHSWKAFTFNVIAKNLLNEEYTSRPAIMEAPRNLTFKLDYLF